MVVFGGELHTNESSNAVYVFDFLENIWKEPKVSGVSVPKVDSHTATVVDSKMYVLGGYIPEKAENMKNIYSLDLEKYEWELVYEGKGKGE